MNFLLLVHADRRSKFTPFGISSDERFTYLVDGNDGIAAGLAASLARPVQLGLNLRRARRRSDGQDRADLRPGRGYLTRTHERVVLALPFSVLRGVNLDASLALPLWKRLAINELGYGTNAKMMVGFTSRPWRVIGSNGSSSSDLLNHQTTWETNPERANANRAILTDYWEASGAPGSRLDRCGRRRRVS